MSDIDLDAIRARAQAATPGPWSTQERQNVYIPLPWGGLKAHVETDANAEFIAHARTDVPALLAEVDHPAVGLEATRKALAYCVAERDAERGAKRTLFREWERESARRLAAEAERDRLRMEVQTLQTALREVLTKGESLASQVEAVRALVLPLEDGGPTDDEPLSVRDIRAALDAHTPRGDARSTPDGSEGTGDANGPQIAADETRRS